MRTEMTVDDAINVARVVGDLRDNDADGEVRELAVAARRLARQVDEQSLELERERARRRAVGAGTHDSRKARRSSAVSMAAAVATSWLDVPFTPAKRCSS